MMALMNKTRDPQALKKTLHWNFVWAVFNSTTKFMFTIKCQQHVQITTFLATIFVNKDNPNCNSECSPLHNWQKGKKQAYRVLTKRSTKSKLVKSQAFSTCLLNPSTSSFGEPQGSNLESRDLINPNIISYSPNNNGNLVFLIDKTNNIIIGICIYREKKKPKNQKNVCI